MAFRVETSAEAEAEAQQAYLWISQHSPVHAAKWLRGLRTAIESLEDQPYRCGLAPESEFFEQEIRQLLYGKRRGIYRILFIVRGKVVYVIRVRHGAQNLLEP